MENGDHPTRFTQTLLVSWATKKRKAMKSKENKGGRECFPFAIAQWLKRQYKSKSTGHIALDINKFLTDLRLHTVPRTNGSAIG